MSLHRRNFRRVLLGASALAGALSLAVGPAAAEQQRQYDFDLPAQPLGSALRAYGAAADQQLIFADADVRGRTAPALKGTYTPDQALQILLAGADLTVRHTASGVVQIQGASDPQGGSAADGADGTVQALIVTAQKREENIQDVPIAMSAFTQEDLTRSQVAGGPDLMTQVPNMTFTKTNFSSYSIQIRGIGTQAISATTDAAVAVAFNNTPFIRNHFFEQEFYDLQRVEVLRGPQGTLYGRNATAGVVNVISQKPKFVYEAKLVGDVANYNSTRLEGMVNLPLVDDKVALRLAGAWTKRDGYATNAVTNSPIDGRDLWSTRVSLRLAPTDRIDANLIWEHFEENDDRLRSGKQLCHTHEVTNVAGFPTTHYQTLYEAGFSFLFSGVQGTFSQGCTAASLYSPDSFETPNGLSLPYVGPLFTIGVPIAGGNSGSQFRDPYLSRTQSRDLRVIESTVNPKYRAKSDLGEIQVKVDLAPGLALTSETAFSADRIFSLEDYNRFATSPGVFLQPEDGSRRPGLLSHGEFGGIICDPQVGCADRLVAVDVSTADSRQFSQELRVSSDFDGKFNFSFGANFLRYDGLDKYYVFINTLTAAAANGYQLQSWPSNYVSGVTDNSDCLPYGMAGPDYTKPQTLVNCIYIDPNPIGSLNDLGHNYFLSKNPYKLISYAVFGESYYNLTDKLKLTAGLRWTVDKKSAPLIPSWLLASNSVGYPVVETIRQEWREPTGRLAIDWKPDLSFTDETLLYASYAHGYKAGGANPPPTGVVCVDCSAVANALAAQSATHPKTFDAEYVDAFEVGTKNTLLDGRLTLNGTAFFYDYAGYQISQIVDRSAVNLNFDAKVWGLELEADWRPVENLRLGLKGGYENTRVGDGMKAIDLMDRTAGHADWVVVRPFPTYPSNCILPAALFAGSLYGEPLLVNLGGRGGGAPGPCELAYVLNRDPVTDAPYVDLTTVTGTPVQGVGSMLAFHPGYQGWDPSTAPNHGAGFYKDLSGNELPNAPHFTATVTADYTIPLPNSWLATLHTDLYYQSEAWTRIFNTPGYDKLKAYTNVNLAAIFSNEDAGWKVMAYVKNVFDRDSITGAFLNSDDTGLTTNVFLTEPRLYGLRVTKEWSGGVWWPGANANHTGPYPLTVEVGGVVQRQDAPNEAIMPGFADAFPQPINKIAGAQDGNLDWGGETQLRVSYRPSRYWSIAAGVRYGRANAADRSHSSTSEKVCAFPTTGPYAFFGRLACDPSYSYNGGPAGYNYAPNFFRPVTDSADVGWTAREEHKIVDFNVGHDVGLGGLSRSTMEAGLRYASFGSDTSLHVSGIPDWNVPEGWFLKYSSAHKFTSQQNAARTFDGLGPTVSWQGAASLLGNSDTGVIDIDWSVTGGVLFGKQRTSVTGYERSGYFNGAYLFPHTFTAQSATPVNIHRSTSVTAPMLDLSLGLSYELQRIKLGAGYRWERYYNVLDAGFAEHKDYDRTLDGPYFKVSIGFGG